MFEKLIITDESDKNTSNKSDILKPKLLQAVDQIPKSNKCIDTESPYDFIARICATFISKEPIVIEEPIAQNVIFNKKLF